VSGPLPFAEARRLIVKVGSALLAGEGGAVRRDWAASLATEIADRVAGGQRVVLVSSGAIALGAAALGLPGGGRRDLESAQAAAAVGQIALAALWSELFAAHGLRAAQLLLTLGDLEDRRRFLNAAATIDRLLGLVVVPVVNENDTVATAEIRFGDNDRLAARVGVAAGAEAVLLLSNVDGLMTADPARDPAATRIAEVRAIDEVAALAGGARGPGTGGMAAKLAAARIAVASGIWLGIADGRVDRPLSRFLGGGVGTVFVPQPGSVGRARAWLVTVSEPAGRVTIDAGAAAALAGGASLLAAGVTAVDGGFDRADVVEVLAPGGRPIARGLSAYRADSLRRIMGLRSDEHAAALGHEPRSAVIHRDQMVLL
jgi:glutamate 5-kinase